MTPSLGTALPEPRGAQPLPELAQCSLFDETLEPLEVQIDAGGQHGAHIAGVLGRTAFTPELELHDDHVLGRRQREQSPREGDPPAILETPTLERIRAGQIEVGLQAALRVDEVEVAARVPRALSQQDRERRSIELGGAKRVEETL